MAVVFAPFVAMGFVTVLDLLDIVMQPLIKGSVAGVLAVFVLIYFLIRGHGGSSTAASAHS